MKWFFLLPEATKRALYKTHFN
jgi:isopenicillin N synthase-like dioxygenase